MLLIIEYNVTLCGELCRQESGAKVRETSEGVRFPGDFLLAFSPYIWFAHAQFIIALRELGKPG